MARPVAVARPHPARPPFRASAPSRSCPGHRSPGSAAAGEFRRAVLCRLARPRVTSSVSSSPSRITTTCAVSPAGASATRRTRPRVYSTSVPAKLVVMTSPVCRPASRAGPSGTSVIIRAASHVQTHRLGHFRGSHLDHDTQPAAAGSRQIPAVVQRLATRHSTPSRNRCRSIAVGREDRGVSPITSPFRLNSGPPELPRLIAASVCR